MSMRTLLFSLLFLSIAGLAGVHAKSTGQGAGGQAYKAAVPVADTSDAQRNHAFAVALGSILVRNAGPQLTDAPGYTDALGNAANLVQDYQYVRSRPGAAQPFVLDMEFDPAAVQLLVQSLQKQLASAEPASAASAMPVQTATVWVSPMRSAMDLARLISTVRADPKVTSAEPVGAESDGVMLRIKSHEGMGALLGSMQSGGHLVTADSSHPGANASLEWVH